MGFVEKRSGEGKYRARYRDPLGQQRCKTFGRKADAQRFLLEMESDKARGGWIDPRGAEMPLVTWAEEFLLLCRRLAPTTQDAYRRDLKKYVLPRFGAYRLGRIPADEIENWLNDEIDAGLAPSSVHRHYRTLRRMLQVAVGGKVSAEEGCSVEVAFHLARHPLPEQLDIAVVGRVEELPPTALAVAVLEGGSQVGDRAMLLDVRASGTRDRRR